MQSFGPTVALAMICVLDSAAVPMEKKGSANSGNDSANRYWLVGMAGVETDGVGLTFRQHYLPTLKFLCGGLTLRLASRPEKWTASSSRCTKRNDHEQLGSELTIQVMVQTS